MSDLSQLQSAIARNLDRRVYKILITRGNELHCQIERGTAPRLAGLLRDQFHAELVLMVANDRRADKGVFEIHYLFANARENWFLHSTEELTPEESIISLATFYYPASRFEREIQDLFGIQAIDHPDPRPLVRHAFWPKDYFPLRKDAVPPEHFEDDGTPFPFKPVGGEGVYEIPVGPVHAGIIEPGHFRFSVIGETVIDLKIRLYFTHKGTEKLFEGRLPADGVGLAERISGDTTIGHSLAYCQALESLAGTEVPSRARYLRVILLEMERLYNHIADFGAIANDTGFAIAHAHCSRLREQLLRLNKLLTGNRLLRGGLVPGGVRFDLPDELDLAAELYSILSDFNEVVDISVKNTILIDRLEGTGCLTRQTSVDHGALGYVARASGVDIDIRRDHPFAAYSELDFTVPVRESGDVYARTMMRVDEAAQSVAIIRQACKRLASSNHLVRSKQPAASNNLSPSTPLGPSNRLDSSNLEPGELAAPLGPLPAFEPAFGIVEGWRGAIIHWVMVDGEGKIYRVKIKDPSFVNWPALSFALLKNIVPDFPLCNKSFNLSYSGNDL